MKCPREIPSLQLPVRNRVNLTQECHPHVKYLSNLLICIQTYILIGKTFRKIRGNGNFKSISFVESHQPLEVETFTHNNPNIQPVISIQFLIHTCRE